MKKGETATEIFFVRSGIVETTEKDPTLGGDEDYKVSAIVEKGDCFGDEVVFAHDDTRMKFARCRTDVELLVLKKADLLEILGEGEDSRKMEKTVAKQSALLSSFLPSLVPVIAAHLNCVCVRHDSQGPVPLPCVYGSVPRWPHCQRGRQLPPGRV